MTFTNVSTLDGTVVLFTTAAASISPAHGDSVLTGFYLKEDETRTDIGEQLHCGLSTLIKGTSQFFCVIFADRGYDYYPHNVAKDNICRQFWLLKL